MLKILILGDIMGKVGRKALVKKLSDLRKKYKPDLVIANGENIAHGLGVTTKTLHEVHKAGVDFFTTGNHVWNKEIEFKRVMEDNVLRSIIIRPSNYKKIYRKPGKGHKIIKAGGKRILVINILGRVFMKGEADKVTLPIPAALKILDEYKKKSVDAILLDLHTEATSEKRAMGWALNGKASLVWGTHTHIPTADAQILPDGTGYITDLGMCGARDSVIGDNKEEVVSSMMKKNIKLKHSLLENGPAVIQGIYVELGKNLPNSKILRTIKIQQVLEEVIT
ncbi:MAG: metallophosphoesterase [Parcubacteria group bacterium CG10_big_fil_rev_8_21_14_0_10_36_14]|nr:MAG: metallophosphoesterase [Parcubacteria group bacterium CG10_big_fil_rev_8_21_14_0_10_36_14]